MVQLRLFHSPLTIRVVKERQHFIERLFGIVQDVGKGSALTILKKMLSTNEHLGRHRAPS